MIATVGHRTWTILPGFGLALGITLTYLGLIVLIPLSGLLLKADAGNGCEPPREVFDP